MKDFLAKWQNDKKYQIKIKLIVYTFLVAVISIYAISISNSVPEDNEEVNIPEANYDSMIVIPNEYKYDITIDINDKKYRYYGENTSVDKTIIKVFDDNTVNYLFKNNEYYREENGLYIKTTKNEIYNTIDDSYINLDNINKYLSKAEKNGNQYIIYLKDIVLNNESDDYFIINIMDNEINIDYTPLMKIMNDKINKYNVNIKILEIE